MNGGAGDGEAKKDDKTGGGIRTGRSVWLMTAVLVVVAFLL
jgi:hypothetical protein